MSSSSYYFHCSLDMMTHFTRHHGMRRCGSARRAARSSMREGISIHAADARESGWQVSFHSERVQRPLRIQTTNFKTPPFKAKLKRRNLFFFASYETELNEFGGWEGGGVVGGVSRLIVAALPDEETRGGDQNASEKCQYAY